ncbi:putative manganese transporter [uncultured Idiomarina sp.]|uniref:putative manganese transporter n=1 Tax=uncultured Idiomarina sp. TaxID=352961 RepID=UPI002598369A|nr:putative manganese transporter [uncultured Idiomarina sp.]
MLWAFTSDLTGYSSITSEEPTTHHEGWLNKSVLDTQFVTGWVVLAFLAFEIPVQLFGIDVAGMFNSWGPMVVLMAVVIGFLPGCGPQILVTSLYINGSIPFSAQLGNAISNDGDALFPAIALAPQAALLATLYSAIPAFVAAYGFYFLFE